MPSRPPDRRCDATSNTPRLLRIRDDSVWLPIDSDRSCRADRSAVAARTGIAALTPRYQAAEGRLGCPSVVAMAVRATRRSSPSGEPCRAGECCSRSPGWPASLLRVWVYRASLGTPDSDEAVDGPDGAPLPARRAVDVLLGPALRRHAGGAAHGAGVPRRGSSLLALRIVPIVLSAVAALVVWRVGRRTIGEPAAACRRRAVLDLAAVHAVSGHASAGLLRQQPRVLAACSCCWHCGSWSGPTGCGPGCSGSCSGSRSGRPRRSSRSPSRRSAG